jgi:hypothetical protein
MKQTRERKDTRVHLVAEVEKLLSDAGATKAKKLRAIIEAGKRGGFHDYKSPHRQGVESIVPSDGCLDHLVSPCRADRGRAGATMTCPPVPSFTPRQPAPDVPCGAHPPPSTIVGTIWCRLCGAWRPEPDYPLEYTTSAEVARRYVMAGGCYYCALESRAVQAMAVFHDGRGCTQVCAHHYGWRQTTSRMLGHSRCCVEAKKTDVKVYGAWR